MKEKLSCQDSITLNILTTLIQIRFEMFGQFLFLLGGQKGFSASVIAADEFVFAVLLKVFEGGANASFGEKHHFGNLDGGPTTTKKDDGFDTVCLVLLLECFVELFQLIELPSRECVIRHALPHLPKGTLLK